VLHAHCLTRHTPDSSIPRHINNTDSDRCPFLDTVEVNAAYLRAIWQLHYAVKPGRNYRDLHPVALSISRSGSRVLKALQNTLMQQRYYPQPVKRIAIPKADGTRRPLGILTVPDRIVQRAVCLTIEPLFDAGFEECSHGFRRGRSVHTALDQVVRLINLGYAWLVDLDIADCFDRINTALLFTFIKDTLKDAELRRIIWAWLEAETVAVERQGFLRKQTARGLLQGGILPPLFANVYLDRFDKMVLKHGLKLVRYADDCLFCCRSQADAEAVLEYARQGLARLDLAVNPGSVPQLP
jgi:RNA-directed DNA polymerase